jgi:VWFA-related protein
MRKLALPIIVVFLSLTSAVAQDKKKPSPSPSPTPPEVEDVVRVNTELVQTDVTVFDKDGKFVSGLKPEQFELLVDGQPQPIAFFDSVVTGGRNEASALRAGSGKKHTQPVVEEPAEPGSGRTILFFVNDLHLAPGSLSSVHKTIGQFIDTMLGPNDQVAITSASGQIGFLQQLTNNPLVLRAALDRIKFVPGAATDAERPPMSDYAAYLIGERNDRDLFEYFVRETIKANTMKDPDDRPIATAMVERRVGTTLRAAQATIKTSFSSLVNLVRATAKVPGRKLVFFISDGFVPQFGGSDFTMLMSRVTGSANRSSVVIYTLDARGLSVDPSLDASSGGGFDTSGVMRSRMTGELTFTQEPLHALAADTGGRALLNSNDLTGGIARALDETSRYYLLAWRPANDAQRASNFSKIKITIAGRPELKVQWRRGYLGPPPEKNKNQPAQAAASMQVENTDVLGVTEASTEELHAAIGLGYKQASGPNMQLTTAVQLNAQSPDNSSGKIDVNVLGALFDSKGKPVGSFKQRIEVPRTPAQSPLYATVNHQMEVPPGLYQVRILAYERAMTVTNLTGAMEWIEIPKLKAGSFAISSLYVGEITESGAAAQVGVNASRRFARNSRMRFTTFIYNAGTPPQLTAQIKVMHGDKAVIAPPEIKISTEKLSNFANIPYAGEFPLSSLPPGNYELQMTITDQTKKASASQQFKFTVY